MARIRSVHPALFTDESWVSCSMAARLLVIGLWTDADDQGLFEWRPLQIKMRIYPADMVDVSTLLDELSAAGIIKPFEVDGKRYGAIKNFRKSQRPKKPNAVHPLPNDMITYVGSPGKAGTGSEQDGDEDAALPPSGGTDPALNGVEFGTGGEPVPNQFRTGGEKVNQMEDGEEGRVEEDSPPTPPPVGREASETFRSEAFRSAMAAYPERGHVHTKPDQAWDNWQAAAHEAGAHGQDPDGEAVLLACVGAYAARLNSGHTGVPGFQTWLRKGQWKVWIGSSPPGKGQPPAPKFPGPASLRTAMVKASDEDLVVTCIDPAAWDDEARVITTRTNWAAQQIGQRLAPWLDENNITVAVGTRVGRILAERATA